MTPPGGEVLEHRRRPPVLAWMDRRVAGVVLGRLAFPLVVCVVAICFTAGAWSGTSVGALNATENVASPDSALVAGTPRVVRTDEWNVAAPLIVAQSVHDYPRVTQDGMGSHDLSVILDIPNRDWSTVFRPWDAPMLALDVQHGFAARWWLMSVILLLGAYLFLLALTSRTGIAVLFSLGLWLSPFFAWWYLALTLESVGLALLAAGAFLYALKARTRPRRSAWLVLAVYSTVAWALVLYPPFQVPTAIVVGLVTIGEVVGLVHESRIDWRRLAVDLGVVAVGVAVIVLAYYVHDRSTIDAITNSAYPGRRRSTGGNTSLTQLLSAPFGWFLARNGSSLTTTNQSEVSSFLLLGPFVALQLYRVGLRGFTLRTRLAMFGAVSGMAICALWYFIGLPSFVAKVLLLDRVEAPRALLGIGLAGFLLAALFLCAEPLAGDEHASRAQVRQWNQRLNGGAAVCGLLALGMYLWGARMLTLSDPALMSMKKAALFALAAGVVVFLIAARKALIGGCALVLLGGIVTLVVNPVYQGLGLLQHSPLVAAFQSVANHPPEPQRQRWLSFDGFRVNDELIASGVPTLNAVDVYPNPSVWHVLDPHGRSKFLWDRYANMRFMPGLTGSAPQITLPQADLLQVTIDPCGAAVRRLGVGFVVAEEPLTAPCLEQRRVLDVEGDTTYIFAVN